MKRVRGWLITVILFVIAVRILWWAVEPMIPWLLTGAVLIGILSLIWRRRT